LFAPARGEEFVELGEELAAALFPVLHLVAVAEIGALLCVDHARALGRRQEFERGERGRERNALQRHRIGGDDAAVLDQVEMHREVGDLRPALEAEARSLMAADADVVVVGKHLPALALDEPLALLRGVDMGAIELGGAERILPLDGEGGVLHAGVAHLRLLPLALELAFKTG
jgi:hypothetical protein